MDRENVLSKLAGLTRLPANELKDMWRDLFGKEPPTFNRNFMEARIAYRIQELAFGGDVEKITKRIKNINQHNHDKKFRREAYRPPVGTVLSRHEIHQPVGGGLQNNRHEVERPRVLRAEI
jgi:hypothetical protein